MTRLYHWTCEHMSARIRADGVVRPNGGISWWTDLDKPGKRTRNALGLTSHALMCDRMRYRCEAADPAGIVTWFDYLATRTLDMRWAAALESAPGARPEHWWLAAADVPVRRVRRVSASGGR